MIKRKKKNLTSIKVSQETLAELRRFKAWLELSTGRKYSIEKTIREMATEFNKAVTIPWGEIRESKKTTTK